MQNENFLLAVILSIAILVGFHYLYEKPQMERYRQQMLLQKESAETKLPAAEPTPVQTRSRAEIVAEGERVSIKTPELKGSINLKGARLDDLELVNYRETIDPKSARIILFSPAGSAAPHQPYYAEFGWLGSNVNVPDQNAVWKTDSKALTPKNPVKLTWDNGQGLIFERVIAVDEEFMFTVTDGIRNNGSETATLFPYGLIARKGRPETIDSYVLHEGPIGVLNGTLNETKYKDLMTGGPKATETQGGWMGITDKYWLVALIPAQNEKLTATYTYAAPAADTDPNNGTFQSDFRGTAVSLAPGAAIERATHFFAGAKRVKLLDHYGEKLSLPLFDHAIDFGWYYYLTKNFLLFLDYLGASLGNFGLAILVFTIMLKLLTLPLSLKSYRSMAKMKDLQPQIKAIQERYKDDKQQQSMEMMALYKREKVNPMSGCGPMLIQIPIFYALYKVLYVGIELRQAPLFGWIKDMSAPDPTSVLTAFGAIDWSFVPHIGVWPILMGISMYLQQKLSPQPPDKTQAQVFAFLPLIFTFMMAKVAVGLIVYWTFSNILGIGQQWLIMRKK